MRKITYVIGILLIVSLAIATWFKFGRKTTPMPIKNTEENQVKVEQVNTLSLDKRPYITIEPKSKTRPGDSGHWITVSIDKTDSYQRVEYDVEYMAGNLIQGFMHTIDFSKETAPFSKEGFFGSESKGKYKYDENVKSGNILFKFFKDESNYDALKTYFNIQNMAEQKGVFNSNDGKAILEVKSTEIGSGDYVVISSTLGLPKEATGKTISEPYGFYSDGPVKLKNAALTIKSNEDLSTAKLMGWKNNDWVEFTGKAENNSYTASVDQLGMYILVSSQ